MLCERVYPPLIIEYKSSKTWKYHLPRLNYALVFFLLRLALYVEISYFLFLSLAHNSLTLLPLFHKLTTKIIFYLSELLVYHVPPPRNY